MPKAVTCPYHGWSYDLTGRLRATPDADRFSQGIDRDALSLKPVKVELWAGLVWINMDPDAAPLADFLGPIQQRLAPYRFETMTLVADQTVSLDANWKTVIDNFNEQYHVDFLHPQHASFVDCCNAANQLWPHGHRSVQVEGFVVNPRYPIPEELPPLLKAAIAPLGMDPTDFTGRVADLRTAVQRRKRELPDARHASIHRPIGPLPASADEGAREGARHLLVERLRAHVAGPRIAREDHGHDLLPRLRRSVLRASDRDPLSPKDSCPRSIPKKQGMDFVELRYVGWVFRVSC